MTTGETRIVAKIRQWEAFPPGFVTDDQIAKHYAGTMLWARADIAAGIDAARRDLIAATPKWIRKMFKRKNTEGYQ